MALRPLAGLRPFRGVQLGGVAAPRRNLAVVRPFVRGPPHPVMTKWSPYRPYGIYPKQGIYVRGSDRRKRRDNVWIKRFIVYESKRLFYDDQNRKAGFPRV